MDLNRYLAIGRRWLWLLVLLSSLSSLSTLALDARRQPIYESQVQLLIGPALSSSNVDLNELRVSSQLVQVYADLVTTRPMLQTVLDELGLALTPDALRASVKVIPLPETQVLKIRVRHPSPYWAALIANTLAEALVKRSPGIASAEETLLSETIQNQVSRLSEHITLIETDMAEVQRQLQQAPAASADPSQITRLDDLRGQLSAAYAALANLYAKLPGSDANQVETLEPAIPNLDAVAPQVLLDVLLGAAVGLVIAAVIAFFLEYLNDTINVVEDLSRLTAAPVVGAIAQADGWLGGAAGQLVTLSLNDSTAAEDYRVLRANLQSLGLAHPGKCLVVTSPDEGEGKSEVAANLAVAFAQVGMRVVLVDTDLWQPRLAQLFDLPQFPGVTDTLVNSPSDLELAQFPQALWTPTLRVLPSGLVPSNPSAMLTSQRWRRLLEDLKRQADLVILDSTPVLPHAGALLLAKEADAVLLAVNVGKTSRQSVRRAIESLQLAGAKAIRVVLNEPIHDRRYHDRSIPARPPARLPSLAGRRPRLRPEPSAGAAVRVH